MPIALPDIGSINNLFGLIFVIVAALLLIAFYFLVRQGLKPDLRPLSGYQAMSSQVGQAVESGGRVHVSVGANGIIGEETGTTLAGLAVVDMLSDASAISDRAPVATTANATTLPVMADTMRRSYRDRGVLEKYETTAPRMVALDPIALAGGVTSIIGDEQVAANILAGSFGPEAALITEAGNRKHISQVVGSDRVEAQAAGYVTADHVLIGEELFVARAYLQNHAPTVASALVQDVLRWIVIVGITIAAARAILGL